MRYLCKIPFLCCLEQCFPLELQRKDFNKREEFCIKTGRYPFNEVWASVNFGWLYLLTTYSYINRRNSYSKQSPFHFSYRQLTIVWRQTWKVAYLSFKAKAHRENTNLFKENIFQLNTSHKSGSAQRKKKKPVHLHLLWSLKQRNQTLHSLTTAVTLPCFHKQLYPGVLTTEPQVVQCVNIIMASSQALYFYLLKGPWARQAKLVM